MYRFIRCFSAILLAALLLCGCTEVSEGPPAQTTGTTVVTEKPYPVTADALVFEQAPVTVVSLSPAVTEIICELGYGDKIIGRSSYCDYPEEISSKNEFGSAANPDVEAIIEAAPELLISMSPIAKKDITSIEAAGTRVWIIHPPKTMDELYLCYNNLAAVFGGGIDSAAQAETAVEPLKKALEDAEGTMGSFVYIMSPDLAAANGETFAGNFFSFFGSNASADTEELSLTVDELLELDPDWLILPDFVSKYELPEETAALSAVSGGRIIYIDEEVMARIERPTSRLDNAVYKIIAQIEDAESGEAVTEPQEAENQDE